MPRKTKTTSPLPPGRLREALYRAAGAFRLAAWGLMRSTSYLGAYLRRQRSRLGAPKAVTATAHKLARIVYALMRYGVGYVKQTEQAYMEQTRQKMEKQFHRRAKELGYEVRKIEPVAVEPSASATESATVSAET